MTTFSVCRKNHFCTLVLFDFSNQNYFGRNNQNNGHHHISAQLSVRIHCISQEWFSTTRYFHITQLLSRKIFSECNKPNKKHIKWVKWSLAPKCGRYTSKKIIHQQTKPFMFYVLGSSLLLRPNGKNHFCTIVFFNFLTKTIPEGTTKNTFTIKYLPNFRFSPLHFTRMSLRKTFPGNF